MSLHLWSLDWGWGWRARVNRIPLQCKKINVTDHCCSHVKEDIGRLCEPEKKRLRSVQELPLGSRLRELYLRTGWRETDGWNSERGTRYGQSNEKVWKFAFARLTKSTSKPHVNVHLLQKPSAQTTSLCFKSQLLVGQFYFNHQEIQDRKPWAKARLAEAITQTCRALQPNSHRPLMKRLKDSSPKVTKSPTQTQCPNKLWQQLS